MPALYRQYRPVAFSEIIGQDHITSVLQQEVLQGKVAHAYVFQGPRGTGKTTTARVFAKRLQCKDSTTAESCGTCNSCVALQEHKALDVLEIDAASNRGIDDIRALRETANLAPTLGKYKIYIIDEVHMLSAPAFAALLKTLEEPPKHVVFILATTELKKVPATILSRCQLFRFKRATYEEMKSRLEYLLKQENRTADDALISFIIARSDGCYRDAESLLGQILSQSEEHLTPEHASKLLGIPSPEIIANFIQALIASDAKQAVALATQAHEDGFDVDQFLQEAVRYTREAAVKAVTENKPTERFTVIMRAFLGALQDIAYVPEPMIAIELAIITACVGSPPSAPREALAKWGPGAVASKPAERAGAGEGKAPVAQPTTPPFDTAQGKPNPPSPDRLKATSYKLQATLSDAPETLKKIQSSWEAIIQAVRATNPVASTFLRATHPESMNNSMLTIRMQFPLHKTFFEKPENKELVQQALSTVIGEAITITTRLESMAQNLAQVREQKKSQKDDLIKNVQEVFGMKVG